MSTNFALAACTILVVTERCCGIHFLELPGFDSEVSHEHRGLNKPLKTDPDTGSVHNAHHKKSIDYKHFRRMQAKSRRNPEKLDQHHDADISSLKIPAHENINQEVQDMVTYYEHEMMNRNFPAVNENIEPRTIEAAEAVQTGFQYKNPPLRHKIIPVNGEGKHWPITPVPIVRKNMESQNNNGAAIQIDRQNQDNLRQEVILMRADERKYWRNTAIPKTGEIIEPQNIGKAAKVYTERQNDKRSWRNTKTLDGRENMETHNVDAAEEIQTQRQDRYPPLSQTVRVNMESHKNYEGVQTEHQNRYPPLKQKVKENMQSQNIDTAETVQTQRQNRYPPLRQKTGEDLEPQNNNPAVKTERQYRYPLLKQKAVNNMESHNDDAGVQTELYNKYPPLKPMVTTDYYIERRHWLVARKGGDSSNIPPINKDDKDATLKAKINMLVNQTVRDTDDKVKSIQDVKDVHREKAPYKIGFIVSMVKKSRDVLNELFNVAVKHRDEWKALEQLKIFELIVHTNVDTTNLVRQLVEIHVQHLNSTSSGGDETTEASGGGRRVVLI